MAKEFFDIYDDAGNRIGTALRSECHGNPALLHRTAHVVVIHPDTGDILLQKRKMTKDIQPGKWDTAVGGHLDAGEDYLAGAKRELSEELGISGDVKLEWLFVEKVRNSIESEDAGVFALRHPGPFRFQESEIDELRFWSKEALFDEKNRKNFTPLLLSELDKLRKINII
ncbi:MAG: NUDIX domain-containing protein [Lentisphaerae bacterium]|nr:NUDIX domain-containing protein [Lentisphaerota bacterium]